MAVGIIIAGITVGIGILAIALMRTAQAQPARRTANADGSSGYLYAGDSGSDCATGSSDAGCDGGGGDGGGGGGD